MSETSYVRDERAIPPDVRPDVPILVEDPLGPDRVPHPAGAPWLRQAHPVPLTWVVVLVLLAGVAGAGAAALVARATGWGSETVVDRYVANTSDIAVKPAGVQAILLAVQPAVVRIRATSNVRNPFFGPGSELVSAEGTGIIVTSRGQVVTNDHVVSGATAVTVTLNGSSTELPARIIGTDPGHDLALLQISRVSGLPTVTFGDSSHIVVGDAVIAVGYALGLPGDPTVTSGIVSALDRRISTETVSGRSITLNGMLQTDTSISSGNSGGPLVDSAGAVIGLTTEVATSSRGTSADGIGFAIPSRTVQVLLPGLRVGGTGG